MAQSEGLYGALELIETHFRLYFNRIVFGDLSELDLQKQSIYPIMLITLDTITTQNGAQQIAFTLNCFDIIYDNKSEDPRDTPNEFSDITNIQDIFQDLNLKINAAYTALMNDRNVNMGDVATPLALNAFYYRGRNKLAGYQFNITIELPKTNIC